MSTLNKKSKISSVVENTKLIGIKGLSSDDKLNKENISRIREENKLRIKMLWFICWLTGCWIIFVMVLIFLNGLGLIQLSSGVISLISHTTFILCGFNTLIVRYFFNPKHST